MKITHVTSDFSVIILVNYFIYNNHLLNSNEYSLGYILFLELDNAAFFIFFLTEFCLFGLSDPFFHILSLHLWLTFKLLEWLISYSLLKYVLVFPWELICLSLFIPSFLFLYFSLGNPNHFGLNCDLYTMGCQVYILAIISFRTAFLPLYPSRCLTEMLD